MIHPIALASILSFAFTLGGRGAVQTGDLAPDFSLLDQAGVSQKLSTYRGSKVVVYFYPKDDTPGCTKEACSIRDDYALFEQNGIKVLGVSYDAPQSHLLFAEKYKLPFTLLSDTDKAVSKLYGTNGLFFSSRKTFLIDEQGIIRKIYEHVTVTGHGAEILTDLLKLEQPAKK